MPPPAQDHRHGACVRSVTTPVSKLRLIAAAFLASLAPCLAHAASEVAQADAQRKKPLQRCDQLSDKAEIECLQKARERIVEARQKRQAPAQDDKAAARAKSDMREPAAKK